jgi:hypothetical protein
MSASRSTFVAGVAFTLVMAACGSGAPTQAPPIASPTPAPTPAPTEAATAPPTEAPPVETATPAAPDPLALAEPYVGMYTGTWINETFGSTGSVGVLVSVDRSSQAVILELTLGGNVFGQKAPKPETLRATIGPNESLTFTSKTFGETTLSVTLEGGNPAVTMSSPDVPSDRIKTFTATTTIVDPSQLEFEYTVTFRDGVPPATGKATLTR